MAKRSTDKGKRGEQEVVRAARDFELHAQRTAPLQANGRVKCADVLIEEAPGFHIEVKRDQKMSVDAMVRQATADASGGQVPIVVWRRDRGQWRADMPLETFFALVALMGHGWTALGVTTDA